MESTLSLEELFMEWKFAGLQKRFNVEKTISQASKLKLLTVVNLKEKRNFQKKSVIILIQNNDDLTSVFCSFNSLSINLSVYVKILLTND